MAAALLCGGCSDSPTSPTEKALPPRLSSCAPLADRGWDEFRYWAIADEYSGLPCFSDRDGMDLSSCSHEDQDRRYLALQDPAYVWGWIGGSTAMVEYQRCMEREVVQ